jgi:translation initiation factor IF-1
MDPAIETASVMNVELRNCHDVVSAIEGRLSRLRVRGSSGDEVAMWSIEERVKVDHVARHVIGPFEDWGRM